MKTIGNKAALLAALEGLNDTILKPEEFTLNDFLHQAKSAGKAMKKTGAISHLQNLCKEGILKYRKVKLDGRICYAYSKA